LPHENDIKKEDGMSHDKLSIRIKKMIFPLFLTIILASTPGLAQKSSQTSPTTQEKAISLSLEECIRKTIENNLSWAVEVLNPQLAEISIAQAKEKFMPQLSFSFNRRDTNSASYSWLDAAGNVTTLYYGSTARITQELPTGGNFSISLDTYKNDSNRNFQTINPRYGSTLQFNFSQPLLRNFGFNISRHQILLAKNNKEISDYNLKKTLQDLIYSVEEAYWNLVYSIENLKVRQQSLQLARELLEKNRRSVEIGTMAPMDVLTAEADVATREADILEAQAQVKNNEDRLKTILNLVAENKELELARIIPKDKPSFEKKEISLEEALAIALANRPDLKALQIDLKNKQLTVNYTKNQLLPELNLTASYWSPGISGSRIIYLNNNPLTGVIIGTIPGGISDSLKDTFNFKYRNWSLGLTLSIPMSNFLSRAAYAQARINYEQALLRLKEQEQQIFLEIKNAVRAVQTNYKRVQAYRVARELAENKLKAEEEKFKVGLSTNYFVLQYQRDLANARTMELRAIIDYNLSLAQLNRALGITLKEKNIRITEALKE
jgi:outer membrane protein TolC